MNEQMETKIFIIGLLILLIAFFILEVVFLNNNNLSIVYRLGGSVGAVSGSLLWGVILWAPVRLVRGKDNAPDIRKFTLITAYIFTALYMLMKLTNVT